MAHGANSGDASKVMLGALALLLCSVGSIHAVAQTEGPAPEQQEISLAAAAALLIQANQIDEADRVLALALQRNSNDFEAIFLRALIAVSRKNYDAAIEDFRHILAVEPERERVRLELARAFFLEADYDNAERNFKFARAGNLPPEAKTIVDQYLAAIIRVRQWSYSVGVALAQDTNANGATTARTIDLYGLPFTLSDSARQKSGLGVAADLAGEWSPLVSDGMKLRIGALVHSLDYSNGAFDDTSISVYGGPEWLFQRWELDALITGFRRWYANAPYADGVGGRGAVSYLLTPTLRLTTSLDLQMVTYRTADYQNGLVPSGNVALGYTVSPSSSIQLTIGGATQIARSAPFGDTSFWLAVDYYRDLPFGFSINLEPAFYWSGYDAPLAAFGTTRSDKTWAFRTDLLNRRLEYRGFAPRLSLIYVSEQSTIGLYRFSRLQAQMGITRQF
jgi:tetratricopeptide (TPR) repeat protein